MSKLVFDAEGSRFYHGGVSQCALYPLGTSSDPTAYATGVAWNGISNITKNSDGGEPNPVWADNMKYAVLSGNESAKGSIKAYTYPDEWCACNGEQTLITGVTFGQQRRKHFGLVWREEIGNDLDPNAGYIIHIMYNCVASPSERSNDTINDSMDALEFSWDFEAASVPVTVGTDTLYTATIDIDSRDFTDTTGQGKLKSLIDKLYGKDPTSSSSADGTDPELPTPDQIKTLLS